MQYDIVVCHHGWNAIENRDKSYERPAWVRWDECAVADDMPSTVISGLSRAKMEVSHAYSSILQGALTELCRKTDLHESGLG